MILQIGLTSSTTPGVNSKQSSSSREACPYLILDGVAAARSSLDCPQTTGYLPFRVSPEARSRPHQLPGGVLRTCGQEDIGGDVHLRNVHAIWVPYISATKVFSDVPPSQRQRCDHGGVGDARGVGPESIVHMANYSGVDFDPELNI